MLPSVLVSGTVEKNVVNYGAGRQRDCLGFWERGGFGTGAKVST